MVKCDCFRCFGGYSAKNIIDFCLVSTLRTEMAEASSSKDTRQLDPTICERHLQILGPSAELFLDLGDAYTHSGDLVAAGRSYSSALEYDPNTSPCRLIKFASALVESTRRNSELFNVMPGYVDDEGLPDPFICRLCQSPWSEPVTVPCGHSFCHACLERNETSSKCLRCRSELDRSRTSFLRVNVLLARTLEKWFPCDFSIVQLKSRANKLLARKQFAEAVQVYSEAIESSELA